MAGHQVNLVFERLMKRWCATRGCGRKGTKLERADVDVAAIAAVE
jgi:hypothetical protein